MVAQGSESHADVRVYQAVHEAFRLATTRLVDATQKLEPTTLPEIIGPRWRFYEAVLHHHHETEDDTIFPALLAVRPDLDDLVRRLEDDHQQLILTMDEVDAAVIALEQEPETARQRVLGEALVAVRDAFFPHLDIEDETILPAIVAAIPPKEWERIDKDALKSIPRKHLATSVGALDEIIQGKAPADRPPPPPIPIRVMLALSWRKKWSNWIQPLQGETT